MGMVIDWVLMNWDTVLVGLMAAHTLASVITALTPTPLDDNIPAKLYKGIEYLALVVGKARGNKDPETPPQAQ